MKPRPTPEQMHATSLRPFVASCALLLVAALMAGCTTPAGPVTHLAVHGGGAALELTIPFDAAARPAMPLYKAQGAAHPDFYSALDQLVAARDAGLLRFNSSYHARFGFFLADINGIAAAGSFWALSLDGTQADKGMGDLRLSDGDKVAWTLTSYQAQETAPPSPTTVSPAAPSGGGSSLSVVAPAATLDALATVTGTRPQGDTVELVARHGKVSNSVPVTVQGTSWTAQVPLTYGRTSLFATTSSSAARAEATLVRLAPVTLEVKYTAQPTHPASNHTVAIDIDARPAAPDYAGKDVGHPDLFTVHDLLVAWSAATGTEVSYQYSNGLGYAPTSFDGVGNPLGLGSTAPPWWCYKVNGTSADLGITLQGVAPGDRVTWEYAGCA